MCDKQRKRLCLEDCVEELDLEKLERTFENSRKRSEKLKKEFSEAVRRMLEFRGKKESVG